MKALTDRAFQQALSMFSSVVNADRSNVDGWCGVSAAHLGLQNFSSALYAARQARELAPQSPQPLFMLAPAALCADDKIAADLCFEEMKSLDQKAAGALARFWVDRLAEHQQIKEAAEAWGAYVEAFDPDFKDRLLYAELLLDAAEPNEALNQIKRAPLESAQRAEVWALKARANLQLGALDDAVTDAGRAISADPDCLPAYVVISEIKPESLNGRFMTQLMRLVNRPEAPTANRALAGYALGRAREAQQEFDAAFAAYEAANRIERNAFLQASRNYERQETEQTLISEIAIFSQAYLSTPPDDSRRGAGLIFIAGMPRSGSTLIDQILSAHSQVMSAGESQALPHVHQTIVNRALKDGALITTTIDAHANEWAELYRAALPAAVKEGPVIVDKMLSNVWRIGLIARIFPAAKVLITKRDPLDTAVSIFRLNFRGAHSYANDLGDIAHYYKCVEALSSHWSSIEPSVCTIIEYERLVGDFENGVRTLLDDCGLSNEEACFDFHKSKRPVATLSAAQVREPVSSKSIGRWRRYENHLEPLRLGLEEPLQL